jgi:hypothetical protein
LPPRGRAALFPKCARKGTFQVSSEVLSPTINI